VEPDRAGRSGPGAVNGVSGGNAPPKAKPADSTQPR
jgi:hypothetical protein